MRFVLDASSVINLSHGGVFESLPGIRSGSFCIGPISCQESGEIPALMTFVASGQIALLDDAQIPAGVFENALREFRLGPGETECLLFARASGDGVVTDDRKARSIVEREFGRERLLGSIGILRILVAETLIEKQRALDAYAAMLRAGGFLPQLSPQQLLP